MPHDITLGEVALVPGKKIEFVVSIFGQKVTSEESDYVKVQNLTFTMQFNAEQWS